MEELGDGRDTMDLPGNDLKKIEEARQKEGYREGVAAGREKFLQDGFDSGYSHGFALLFPIAKWKGRLKATQHQTKDVQSDYLTQVEGLERDILSALRDELEIAENKMADGSGDVASVNKIPAPLNENEVEVLNAYLGGINKGLQDFLPRRVVHILERFLKLKSVSGLG